MELFTIKFIYKDDTPETKKLFDLFKEIMFLLIKPFKESFDFSNKEYLNRIYQLGDELKSRKIFEKMVQQEGLAYSLHQQNLFWAIHAFI